MATDSQAYKAQALTEGRHTVYDPNTDDEEYEPAELFNPTDWPADEIPVGYKEEEYPYYDDGQDDWRKDDYWFQDDDWKIGI